MSCGPLSPKRRTRPGSGLCFAAAPEKRIAYAIGDLSSPVGSHSNSIPSESLQNLLLGSLPSSATRGTAYGGRPRKQAKRPMLNAGTTPCGNALLALSAKHSLFQNRESCMRSACASFSTATTLIELSCSCEALPAERYVPSLHEYGMCLMKHRASD
jgi:hypothetical protein